jgi:hypothetical protein
MRSSPGILAPQLYDKIKMELRNKRRFVIMHKLSRMFTISILFLSCASQYMLIGKKNNVLVKNENKAVIITIRPKIFYGCGVRFVTYIDDKIIGESNSGTYYRTEVDPGVHKISVGHDINENKYDSGKIEIKLEGNRIYYLILYPFLFGQYFIAKAEFNDDEEKINEYLKECVYMEYNGQVPEKQFK